MKTVAYSSPLIPVEWIAAHNLRPWRMLPQAYGQLLTREGVCGYAQAVANSLETEPAEPAEFDGIILATTCDQMRRMHEVLCGRAQHAPKASCRSFLMNIPATWQSASSAGMYMDELLRLGKFMESLGGSRPTNEHLSQTMLAFCRSRQVLRLQGQSLTSRRFVERLHQLCRCSMAELEAFANSFAGERAVVVQASSPADPYSTESVQTAMPATQLPPVEEALRIPLAVIGGPMTADELPVLDMIEDCGGQVVLNATESGQRVLPDMFEIHRTQAAPLAELTRAYFGSVGEIFRRPDSMLMEYLGREIARCRPKGIVLVRQVWCDLWHAQVRRIRQQMNLPLLELDLDGKTPPGSLANRLQAFMEVLQ